MSEVANTPEVKANDETPLTATELAELKSKDLEIARLQAETAKIQLELKQRDGVLADINRGRTWNDLVEGTGIRYHCTPGDLLKLVRDETTKIWFSEDGREVYAEKDGKQVPAAELLVAFSVENAHLTDGRSLKKFKDATQVKSRADLQNRQQKMDYIAEHGLKAFESLPSRSADSYDINKITAAQFSALPLSQKSKITADLGTAGVVEIMNRKD